MAAKAARAEHSAETQSLHPSHDPHIGLLRFAVVGSVDDGKSTLIGRLLHDAGGLFEDQLASLQKNAEIHDKPMDFAHITDGLQAEREQGITIDVAYRYFSSQKRAFVIADTPGHVQYTRNMVTGASTAAAAVILIDARLGLLEQSRRHAALASLLGIRHLVVAINKMDLVDHNAGRFKQLQEDFLAVAEGMQLGFDGIHCLPVSALLGRNVVHPAPKAMPWYTGPTLLELLEQLPSGHASTPMQSAPLRLPIQYVLRPHLDYRGFAGRIAAGSMRPGDMVRAMPSGQTASIASIDTFSGKRSFAHTGQSIAVRLDKEIDLSRGDMLVAADAPPHVSRSLRASLVWMSELDLDCERTYILKHTSHEVRAQVQEILGCLDLDTLKQRPANTLGLNDIGDVMIACTHPIYFEAYPHNRALGGFILIDSATHATVAAGMIKPEPKPPDLCAALKEIQAGPGLRASSQVSPRERQARLKQRGAVVWLCGLPGSGRWALAYALERRLFDAGYTAHVLDPQDDSLKGMVAAARACTQAGLLAICAFANVNQAERKQAQEPLRQGPFLEVFVDTPKNICQERRPDASMEGFEPPAEPDWSVDLTEVRMEEAVASVIEILTNQKIISHT